MTIIISRNQPNANPIPIQLKIPLPPLNLWYGLNKWPNMMESEENEISKSDALYKSNR